MNRCFVFQRIKLLEENKIQIDNNKGMKVSQRKADEHNSDYSSNGMTWDNSEIVEYIQNNLDKVANPKHNRIEIIKKVLEDKMIRFGIRLGTRLDVLISRIENMINKRKSLPEGQEKEVEENAKLDEIEQSSEAIPQDEKTNSASWDLSNWGLDKSDVEYTGNPNSNQENIELQNDDLDIDDGGWGDWTK